MESQGSQGPVKEEVRPQITVSRATKKELKILMIRMDLKTAGDVVDVLLKFYQENHDPWPGGARPETATPPAGGPSPLMGGVSRP